MIASSFRQTGLTDSRAHAASMPCSDSNKPPASLDQFVLDLLLSKCSHTRTQTHFSRHAYTNPEYWHSSICATIWGQWLTELANQSSDINTLDFALWFMYMCVSTVAHIKVPLLWCFHPPSGWVVSCFPHFPSHSSFCPSLPRAAWGSSPTSPEKHYLFIITAASEQRPSTQKPLGGDWVPDLLDSELLCWV